MVSIKLTGLESLQKGLGEFQDIFEKEISKSLGKVISYMGTESQRRTPVATGLLKSSIGGTGGYSFVRGLTAGIGTNVRYAIYVHEGNGRHKVGERKFMEKGAEASISYTEREMKSALERVATHVTSQ